MVMVSASGWRVEKVVRTLPEHLPEVRLRVSWRGYWQADCATTDEVAKYVELSSLVPSTSHLYQRAYPVTPWRTAAERLDTALEKALAGATHRAETQPVHRHLRAVPDMLPAGRPVTMG